MTAYIFPGLGQPKSQLFFDIQAMIAENGGRLNLAKLLESEINMRVKRPQANRGVYYVENPYTKKQTAYIIKWRAKKTIPAIAKKIGRSVQSVQGKIKRLKRDGIIQDVDLRFGSTWKR